MLTKFKRQSEPIEVFGGLSQLRRELDDIFELGGPFRSFGLLEGSWAPLIDMSETKDQILVRAEIPGMKKEEIDVQVQNDTLIIQGERKRESEEKKENYRRVERSYGRFHRAIGLPSEVKADQIKATYKDGILDISLPKKEESKPKQIQVEVK
jgi:HSP20 family protein